MAAASCSREPFDYKGIHFKAKSVGYFGNPRTKTAYTGQGDGNTERIDWTDGDIVTIYSDKAYVLDNPGVHSTDYKVSSHTGDGSTYISTATISPAELANALQWGSGTNTFYAMYPSPSTPGLTGADFDEGEMTFPILATPTLVKDENDLRYTPDMKYAPMLAKATATSGTSSVNLAFAPEYTAFEFTVSKGNFNEIHISNFTLTSTDASEPVSGVITIPAGEYADESAVTVTDEGTSISVDWATPVLLDEDHPNLTITVFTVPKTLSHLKIIYTGTEISTRSLELKNAGGVSLEFPARKKYRIYGLSFPVIVPVDNPEGISWAYTAQVLDNYVWWFNNLIEPQGWENWFTTPEGDYPADIEDGSAWWHGTGIEPEGWEDWKDTNSGHSGDYGAGIGDGLCWWITTGIEPMGWVIWDSNHSGTYGAGIQDGNAWWNETNPEDLSWMDSPLSEVVLSETESVCLFTGESVQRSAAALNQAGYTSPAATINWTFQSQPQSGVVDVKNTNGIVTAVGPGVATIYATAKSYDGTYTCTASYTVYVTSEPSITGGSGTFRGKYVSSGILQYEGGAYSLTGELDGLASLMAAYGTAAGRAKHYFSWEDLESEYSSTPGVIDETIYADASSNEWRLPSISEWADIINNPPTSTTMVGSTSLTNGYAEVVVNLDGSALAGQGLLTGDIQYAGSYIDDGDEIDRTNYIAGLLLIPDGATITCSGLNGTVGAPAAWSTSTNCITYRELEELVDGGCIFLPAAGYYSSTKWWHGGGNGYYWASEQLSSTSACRLYFYTGGVNVTTGGVYQWGSESKSSYLPIRLIHD